MHSIRRFTISLGSLLILFTTCGLKGADAPEPVNLELSAGKHDRQNTPVFFELPEAQRSWKGYQLIDVATKHTVPVQLDPGNPPRLVWILNDSMKANESRQYQLTEKVDPKDETSSVKVQHDDRALRAEVDGKPVLQYNIGVVPSEDPKEPAYSRSGFIHPAYAPSGTVVTDAMPPDHMHQHGIFFAWVDTTFEGRNVDFWNSFEHKGLVRHVDLTSSASGPVFGSFAVKLDHVDITAPGGEKVALHEIWNIHVYKHEGGFLFDLQSTQTCASQSPLLINKHLYGGMAVRGARDWFGPGKCDFLTSEGKNVKTGNQTRPNWCELYGKTGEHEAGIAVLSSPANFDSPQPVRLHPEKPYFSWSPMQTAPFTIAPGKAYVSSYRFFIHDGKPNAAVVNSLYDDFAEPVSVRVVKN